MKCMFSDAGEKVLCFHGPLLYEAKVCCYIYIYVILYILLEKRNSYTLLEIMTAPLVITHFQNIIVFMLSNLGT